MFVIFPKNANTFGRRFEAKCRSASQQEPVDSSQRELATECIFFNPLSIFDPVMADQMLNFGDLFVKIDVFHISEPIAVKVLKVATCNFHERVPWTIIYGMACI